MSSRLNQLDEALSLLKSSQVEPIKKYQQIETCVNHVILLLGIQEIEKWVFINITRNIKTCIKHYMKDPVYPQRIPAFAISPNTLKKYNLDIRMHRIKKPSKSTMHWLTTRRGSFEDKPRSFSDSDYDIYRTKLVGIDFVVSPKLDRIYMMLSKHGDTIRVMELHEKLSNTQREIINTWLAPKLPFHDKAELHARLWQSYGKASITNLSIRSSTKK